jgi:hypothetical protein
MYFQLPTPHLDEFFLLYSPGETELALYGPVDLKDAILGGEGSIKHQFFKFLMSQHMDVIGV